MTSQGDGSPEPVDLGKHGDDPVDGAAEAEPDFDPYRFGLPDHPVPPEFAPPGYRPPEPTTQVGTYSPYGPDSPYGPGTTGQTPYGPGPYAGGPYGPPQQGAYGPPQPGPYGAPPQHGPHGPAPYPNSNSYPPQGGPGHPGYYPTTKQGNGKAVGSLVCGILSVVFCWLAFLDFALVIPGFVLGVIVLSNKQSGGRGMALSGLICAVVGAVLAIVLTVVYVHIDRDCNGLSSSQQNQCIRDKF